MAIRLTMLGDGVNFRVGVVTAKDDMPGGQLPKLPGEGNMLLVIKFLATKKHDFPAQEGRTNVLHRFWSQGLGQIDPSDFCPDVHREGADVNRASGCRGVVWQSLYSHL
jgi:hypothetical protein